MPETCQSVRPWCRQSGFAVVIVLVSIPMPACGQQADPGDGVAERRHEESVVSASWDQLQRWAELHHLRNWPLSNSGDKDLSSVAFLYDVAIQAQYLVARDEVERAADLLDRVVRDWPVSEGQPIDSVRLGSGPGAGFVSFDNSIIDGRPRVTNGPSMQLALSVLTVSALTSRHRERFVPWAEELTKRILHQTTGDGRLPYGPGSQRFDDGTPFREISTPEYQIEAYALFRRMAEVTGDQEWEERASRVLNWLIDNRYDRALGRFYANNDAGVRDFPADVPGWAISMIGPREAAAAGIDLEKLAHDLAQPPEAFFITEWLVNRHNGLTKLAVYFEVEKMEAAAAHAREGMEALRNLLLSLPLQSRDSGGGLAYAYKLEGPAIPQGKWVSAEGMGTGWGWNTQHGSSRIATIYLVMSLHHGHDPVAGEFQGTPIPWSELRPQGADGAQLPTGVGDPREALSRLESVKPIERALRDRTRSESFLLAHRIVNPSRETLRIHIQFDDGTTPVVKSSLFEFFDYVVEKPLTESATGPTGPFAGINLTFKLWETRYLRVNGATITMSPEIPAPKETPEILLLDGEGDFQVQEQFVWTTRRQRLAASPHNEGQNADGRRASQTLSLEEWLLDQNYIRPVELVDGPDGRRLKLGTDLGIVHELELDDKKRRLLVVGGKFVTMNPETNAVTRVFAVHPGTANIPIAFKRPLTQEAYERKQADSSSHVVEEHGDFYEWRFELDTAALQAVDVRVLAPGDREPGDRVVFSPFLLRDAPINVMRSGELGTSGAASGMVIAPTLEGSQDKPGQVFLRPFAIGARDHLTDQSSLDETEVASSGSELLKQPLLLPEYTSRTLDWLSDMEAFLRQVPGARASKDVDTIRQARGNVWIAPDGQHLLVVGSDAIARAEQEYADLLREDASSPSLRQLETCLKFARDHELDAVAPYLSRYESAWNEFQAHLENLSARIREREDQRKTLDDFGSKSLRLLKNRYHRDSRTMSFRTDRGEYLAIIPGFHVANLRVQILEAMTQEGKAKIRPDILQQALIPAERFQQLTATPKAEIHRNHQPLLVDADANTWITATTQSGSQDCHVYDYSGERIFTLRGSDLVINRGTFASDDDQVRARIRGNGLISIARFREDGTKLGDDIYPLIPPTLEGFSNDELLDAARQLDARVTRILRTEAVTDKPNRVKGFQKDQSGENGEQTYTDIYGPSSTHPTESVLVKREYDTTKFEEYREHEFHEDTATWWPGVTTVHHDGTVVEVRTFIDFDSEGRALYEVRSPVPPMEVWSRCVPNFVRPWITANPTDPVFQTRYYEVREPDQILFCRYVCPQAGAGELTFYDLRRQRDIYYHTGQNIEIPTYTAHASSPESYRDPTAFTPFVFYHAVHTTLPASHVNNLAICELNAEATYNVSSWQGPVPEEYEILRDLASKHGLEEPPGRRFYWNRRILVRGQPGIRNQRGESESDMVVVEAESPTAVAQFYHELPQNNLLAEERYRQVLPKSPDGRFYLSNEEGTLSELTLSGDDTRRLPRGHSERRFGITPLPQYIELARVKRPLTGVAADSLSHDGFLTVAFYDADDVLLKISMEDSLSRPSRSLESPVKAIFLGIDNRSEAPANASRRFERKSLDGNPIGRITSHVEPHFWHWHRSLRQWYPTFVYVTRNVVDSTTNQDKQRLASRFLMETRRLLCNASGEFMIDADGNATYDVRRFVTPPKTDPTFFESIYSWYLPVEAEHCHELVRNDGTVLQRKTFLSSGQVVTRSMNWERTLELAQLTGTVPEIPLTDELDGQSTSYDARIRRDGTFELTRQGSRDRSLRTIVYEKAPIGFQTVFGNHPTWRVRSEHINSQDNPTVQQVTWIVYGDDIDGLDSLNVGTGVTRDPLHREARDTISRLSSVGSRQVGLETQKKSVVGETLCPIPRTAERGRVVLSVVGDERRTMVSIVNDEVVTDSKRGQVLVRKTYHWPRGLTTTSWIDSEGREIHSRGHSGDIHGIDYTFDVESAQWTKVNSEICDVLPYVADGLKTGQSDELIRLQTSHFETITSSKEYFTGFSKHVDLFRIRETPAPNVEASGRSIITFYDDLGRPHLQHAKNTGWDEWTYFPHRDAIPFSQASSDMEWKRDIDIRSADFMLLYVRGVVTDKNFRLQARNQHGVSVMIEPDLTSREATVLGEPVGPVWRWPFDDKIVLNHATNGGMRLISAVPMDGHSPDHPNARDPLSPKAVFIPVAWLPESMRSEGTLSLYVVNCPSELQMSPVLTLGPGNPVAKWHVDSKNQKEVFPEGVELSHIVSREPRVDDLGNGVVIIHRGRGTASESRVYDRGRLISTTKYSRERDIYHHVRESFHDSAIPHLRFPQFIETSYDGWLCRHTSIAQLTGGRILIQASNGDEPVMAYLLPYDSRIPRPNLPPTTLYLPIGHFDPLAQIPTIGGNLLNVGTRHLRPHWEPAWSAFPELTAQTSEWPGILQHGLSAITASRYVESFSLNVPHSWRERDIPRVRAPAYTRPIAELNEWAQLVTASMAKHSTGLPETHPDTRRAQYADTIHVAKILRGLIKSNQIAPSRKIMNFFGQATGRGERPILDGYDVHQGIGRSYSRLPALAQSKARPNIAAAHAALEFANFTNNPHDWGFALKLLQRVCEFMPDYDFFWPMATRDKLTDVDLRNRADRQASRLLRYIDNESPPSSESVLAWVHTCQRLSRGEFVPKWLAPFNSLSWQLDHGSDWDSALSITLPEAALQHEWKKRRQEMVSTIFFRASLALRDHPNEADSARNEAIRLLLDVAAMSSDQQDIIRLLLASAGGITETPPSGMWFQHHDSSTLIAPLEVFSVVTNVEAYELFHVASNLLTTPHFQSPLLESLRRDVLIAHALQRSWIQHNVLSRAHHHDGLCPNYFQEQRLISGRSTKGTEIGSATPKVLSSSRWPTLESSLAAARVQLHLFPDSDSRAVVARWLQNMVRVYHGPISHDHDPIHGFDFVPETMARYDGRVICSQLAVEFERLCTQVGWTEGAHVADASLNALRVSIDDRTVLLTARDRRDKTSLAHGIDTGCGLTLFPSTTFESGYAWSPVATLMAISHLDASDQEFSLTATESDLLQVLSPRPWRTLRSLSAYAFLSAFLLVSLPWTILALSLVTRACRRVGHVYSKGYGSLST